MDDINQKMARIEDTAERFPLQMLLIHEVFSFSYAEAVSISTKFTTQAELVDAINQLRHYITSSNLPENIRNSLDSRLLEEIEVITFSQTSRCSVISI